MSLFSAVYQNQQSSADGKDTSASQCGKTVSRPIRQRTLQPEPQLLQLLLQHHRSEDGGRESVVFARLTFAGLTPLVSVEDLLMCFLCWMEALDHFGPLPQVCEVQRLMA